MKLRIGAAVLAGALGIAATAPAQIVGNAARERYEKRTTGTSIEDFVKKLASDDPDRRLDAVRSLGESNDVKAIEHLLEAVGDPDVRVRCKSIDMLGHMRAVEATPVLIQYLFLRTTNPQMKALILAALGKIGDSRAAQPIVDFMQRDLDHDMFGTAIFALGEIGAPESEEPLTRIAETEDNRTLKRLANEALAKVRYRQAALSAEAKEPSVTFLQTDQGPP